MTRAYIYGTGLLAFVAMTALTLSAIIIPRWVSFRDDTSSITYTYGLHSRCSVETGGCSHFPAPEDCHGSDRYFCSIWRSLGWLMSFSIVLEGMVIFAFLAILAGGRAKRETGWKFLSFMLFLVAMVQCTAMALVAWVYDWDDRFFHGWNLDISWIFATVSWAVTVLIAASLTLSAFVLPSEGDYELLK